MNRIDLNKWDRVVQIEPKFYLTPSDAKVNLLSLKNFKNCIPLSEQGFTKLDSRVSARTGLIEKKICTRNCFKQTKQISSITLPALLTGALVFFPLETPAERALAFFVGGGMNALSVLAAWYWSRKEAIEENTFQEVALEAKDIFKDMARLLLTEHILKEDMSVLEVLHISSESLDFLENQLTIYFFKEEAKKIIDPLRKSIIAINKFKDNYVLLVAKGDFDEGLKAPLYALITMVLESKKEH